MTHPRRDFAAPPQAGTASGPAKPDQQRSLGWVKVCRVEDIPVLGARRISRVGEVVPIAVFRNAEDEVFALLDRCPHKGGPLSQGIVFGRSVACPLHNWTIGLQDGCAKAPDEGCAQRFACKVEGGEVLLEAQALSPVEA
jgi:nitrite reductase (NADH) small subunit